MAYRVRIFLRRSDQNAGRFIGERYLRDMPRLRGRVAFELGDTVQAGTVERSSLGTLREGQKVSFELERGQQGKTSAVNLKEV